MKKKLLITCLTAFLAITVLPVNVLAASTIDYQYATYEKEVRKDDIGYQYKVINGELHKRLYNFTKRQPLSDWEVVS